MISKLQEKILEIKKGKTILAHSYVAEEIQEIADYVGDSFKLAQLAAKDKNDTLIMCGVHFMAETCKILAPEKKVMLVSAEAGCPMAEQISQSELSALKEKHNDCAVVVYVNTTAALKELADVCVTSSSAVDICRKIESNDILFIPDCNLGRYVADKIPEKNFHFVNGGCPVHSAVTEQQVLKAKQLHPNARLLVHPECIPEVCKYADYIGSTSGIIDYAKSSFASEFIIGTEISIAEHLQYVCPDKRFYPLSKHLICADMKAMTLVDVYNCLNGTSGIEINMSLEQIKRASVCIDKMLELG